MAGQHSYKQFVFEGGGVKGIGFLGALKQFVKHYGPDSLVQIERVAGASAGAIMALFVGLNYSLDEMETILWDLDFNKFKDDSWGVIRDSIRVIKKFGIYKGDYFESWVKEVIEAKTGNGNITFGEFKRLMEQKPEKGFKSIYFMGVNLTQSRQKVFSCEEQDCEKLSLATAVRISMSIPLFFEAPRLIENKSGFLKRALKREGDVYTDGGVLNNYPINLFDKEGCRNASTLGFRLDSKDEIAQFRDGEENQDPEEITSLFSYANALIHVLYRFQDHRHLRSHDKDRTVYINTLHVKTTDFNLSDTDKKQLIASGKTAIDNFIKRTATTGATVGTTTTSTPVDAIMSAANYAEQLATTSSSASTPSRVPARMSDDHEHRYDEAAALEMQN